jgi:apolipoprotein N-acyltransferase
LDRKKAKKAFLLFFTFSFLSYLVILYWIPGIMAQYGNTGRFLSIAGLLVLSAFLSLFTGLAGVLIRRVIVNSGKLTQGAKIFFKPVFLIPFIWVGKDLALERFLSGFPWCLTGYSQHNNIYFSQAAEIGGVHLITFIIIFINVLFYLLIRDKSKRVLAALAICFLSVYTTGYFLYKTTENKTAALSPHKAGIIQPNAKYETLYTAKINRILKKLFDYSRELKEKGAEFVIWPEYTVPIYPMQSAHYLRMFTGFATTDVPIIAGFNDFFGRDEFYNTAFLFKKDKVEKYYKVHLTPFGEYVPLRKMLFFVKNITSGIGDYTFGKSVLNFDLDGHALSAPICYEVIFPELIRDFAAKGSELLVTLSNDSWEGNTSGPRQILSMATFRSIETRKYMLRSTSTGISAVIAPTGKLIYKSKWGVEDKFIAEFKYIKGKTFFVRFGYLFPYFCFLVTLFYALIFMIGFFKKIVRRN